MSTRLKYIQLDWGRKMSLFFEDFDQWYEAYEAASPLEKYEIVLGIIAKPIPLDYAVETDFTSIQP